MRLWSLHPKYLDPQGLVALWREALLARAVIRGETRGYRNHPQLARFMEQPSAVCAINAYLRGVHAEALARGYSFDSAKLAPVRTPPRMSVTTGQVGYEWEHLMRKLAGRNPALHARWCGERAPQCHHLFRVRQGNVESWERPAYE
jgi:hypothetical protein